MKTSNCHKAWGTIAIVLLALGCATTKQARNTKASPFLGDAASLLKPGNEGQALLVYIKPDVQWQKYQKVVIEPVTYWVGKDEDDSLKEPERKALTDYCYAQLKKQFSKSYTVVDTPGPDTLTYSGALINAEKSWPVMTTVASVIPQAVALSTLKNVTTGKPAGVGAVHGEVKVTDSLTGDQLLVASDKRVGGMGWQGKTNKWEAVESSARYWAQQSVYRLCTLQGRTDCKEPTEG
jgi:hypothetical protein